MQKQLEEGFLDYLSVTHDRKTTIDLLVHTSQKVTTTSRHKLPTRPNNPIKMKICSCSPSNMTII
jgi:hypothetical protein